LRVKIKKQRILIMKNFEVYQQWNVEPVRGLGCNLWDKNGEEYLDLYGGHAVISIGHAHPHYVAAITQQLQHLSFYSNAVQSGLRNRLAEKLGAMSGYPHFSLFLCNSGAEANENAIKLASFHTGKKKLIAFKGAFHGRTSGVVAATDNPSIIAPYNASPNVVFLPLNDSASVEKELAGGDVAGVIIEGIQGVAGIVLPSDDFLRDLRKLCDKYGAALILDEVQSGYGRTGKFFAQVCRYRARPYYGGQRDGERLSCRRRAHCAAHKTGEGHVGYYVWRKSPGLRGRLRGAGSDGEGKFNG
jgi:acetylornithine aminotransferase